MKNPQAQPQRHCDETKIDEMLLKFFATDTTAPTQFTNICRSQSLPPEIELVAAVLENGILDYQRFFGAGDRKSMRRFADAEAWLQSDDCDWLFSFANCCAVLGLDPSYLRRGLQAWRERPPARAASKKFFLNAA